MTSVPRVVLVDPTHDVTRIINGAFALLNRQFILVEVPTAEDALAEVLGSPIDLVVTAYDIPGHMHGIELATQISHESLGTPVIVLGNENDPNIDVEALKEAPFQYFLRPTAEPFLHGLRVALDGEAAVATDQTPSKPAVDLGPIPNIDLDNMRNIVVPLMRDVGAMGVILANRRGRVLIDEGATGYVDREKLAVLLGPAFASSREMGELVGGNAWTMHYYDGDRLDVFGLALGIHYFICLIFDGSNRGAFGAVTMFGRRAADQMIDMIGDTAYVTREAEALPPPKKKEEEMVAAEPQPQAKKKPKAAAEPAVEVPVSPEAEPISDFDADDLFGQLIDESMADSLFDPEKLEELVVSIGAEEEERVGYDEAIQLGILNE
ncbi:MAG: response regulator [Anaerolineae bacterium]|nr:response regulator [Anaerolineae bacterium]